MNPNDISYVYSGYAPLSIRLVQCVSMKPAVLATSVTASNKSVQSRPDRDGSGDHMQPEALPKAHAIVGWRGFEETVRSIPGATFDEMQKPEHEAITNSSRFPLRYYGGSSRIAPITQLPEREERQWSSSLEAVPSRKLQLFAG